MPFLRQMKQTWKKEGYKKDNEMKGLQNCERKERKKKI